MAKTIKQTPKREKNFPVMLMEEARKELFALEPENRAEFISAIDDFEEYGPSHPKVDTEKIEGELYELKTESSSHWLRGFYFHLSGGKYVITHLFAKKTNKTPKTNRELGLSRYKEFKEMMAVSENKSQKPSKKSK